MTSRLSQSRSFSRGTVAAISAVGLTIGPQLLEISFILLPADVPGVRLADEKGPLLLGKRLHEAREPLRRLVVWVRPKQKAPA